MLEDGSKEDIQPGIDIENKKVEIYLDFSFLCKCFDGGDVIKIILLQLKVAFLGISNWALDPAKMNRGILVQRDVPDEKELESSAR